MDWRSYTLVAVVALISTLAGCSRAGELDAPPRPPKDAQIIYRPATGSGVSAYVLAPSERDAMVAVLSGEPAVTFADQPVLPVAPYGHLHVAGRFVYELEHTQVSMTIRKGRKESGYCWQGERLALLCNRLSRAATDQDIRAAFSDFARAGKTSQGLGG